MRDIVTKEGFPYGFIQSACYSCGGRCCTGESGYINVNKSEIERIASFLEIDIDSFKKKYLYKNGYKYSIKEMVYNGSYECVFYDRENNGCSIYMARPIQCRTFPFWEYFKNNIEELKEECPAILD
jgi:Fe-S-cluster containining protein